MQGNLVCPAHRNGQVGALQRCCFITTQLPPLHQAVGGGWPALWKAQIGECIALLEQILAVVVVEDQDGLLWVLLAASHCPGVLDHFQPFCQYQIVAGLLAPVVEQSVHG